MYYFFYNFGVYQKKWDWLITFRICLSAFFKNTSDIVVGSNVNPFFSAREILLGDILFGIPNCFNVFQSFFQIFYVFFTFFLKECFFLLKNQCSHFWIGKMNWFWCKYWKKAIWWGHFVSNEPEKYLKLSRTSTMELFCKYT